MIQDSFELNPETGKFYCRHCNCSVGKSRTNVAVHAKSRKHQKKAEKQREKDSQLYQHGWQYQIQSLRKIIEA